LGNIADGSPPVASMGKGALVGERQGWAHQHPLPRRSARI